MQFIKVFFVIYSNPINDGFGFGYSSTIESTVLIKYYKLFIVEIFKKVGNIDELITKFTEQKNNINKIGRDISVIIPIEKEIIEKAKNKKSTYQQINDLTRRRENAIQNAKKNVRDIYEKIFELLP